MQTVGQQLIITAIPTLPALVFLVLVLAGRLLNENAQYVAILGVTISLVFSVFALLFEVASVLLLVAVVAAIVVSRRKIGEGVDRGVRE